MKDCCIVGPRCLRDLWEFGGKHQLLWEQEEEEQTPPEQEEVESSLYSYRIRIKV